MRRPPVIIIGMHRSGTSLVGRLLEEAGLYLGWRQQPGHAESRFFQQLNDWALYQAGAAWDRPEGMHDLAANPLAAEVVTEYFRVASSSVRSLDYLGPRHFAASRNLADFDGFWGWKDPRTTFTLPLWIELFPDARIVHVIRHGVDVAHSLSVRAGALAAAESEDFARKRWRYNIVPRRNRMSMGVQLSDLDAGIDLWETYVSEARRHCGAAGDRAIEVRFEDLVAEPGQIMKSLVEHCGMSADEDWPWADRVNGSRKFAFQADAELIVFSRERAELLDRFDYQPA